MYDDGTPNCPSGIVIENNIFHYPFCWECEGEDCSTAVAVKYSISNETACGKNACSDDAKVRWVNNDFRYQWKRTDRWAGRGITPPSAPQNLTSVAVTETQVDLTWDHDERNGERFVIQRKSGEGSYIALRIVDSHVKSYSDRNLTPTTRYT